LKDNNIFINDCESVAGRLPQVRMRSLHPPNLVPRMYDDLRKGGTAAHQSCFESNKACLYLLKTKKQTEFRIVNNKENASKINGC